MKTSDAEIDEEDELVFAPIEFGIKTADQEYSDWDESGGVEKRKRA